MGSGHMVLARADSGDPAAFFPHVGGDGEVTVDPGAGTLAKTLLAKLEFPHQLPADEEDAELAAPAVVGSDSVE
jgi:hypothetical protein